MPVGAQERLVLQKLPRTESSELLHRRYSSLWVARSEQDAKGVELEAIRALRGSLRTCHPKHGTASGQKVARSCPNVPAIRERRDDVNRCLCVVGDAEAAPSGRKPPRMPGELPTM